MRRGAFIFLALLAAWLGNNGQGAKAVSFNRYYAYLPDPLGLRTNIVRNLGLTSSTVTVGFDKIGQITSWLASETNGAARFNEQLGWGYDAANKLLHRTNNLLAQTFNSDAANELTNVTRTGTFTLSGATPAPATSITVNGNAAQTYGDLTFARTNNSLADGNNTFTIIAQNAYSVKVTNNLTLDLPQSVTLQSDANGNLTNDGLHSLAYDAENQLTNITVAGSWKSDFVYDGLNRRRIEQDYSWSGSAWTKTNEVHFLYDGYQLVQERDAANDVLVTYTRGLDLSSSLSGAEGIGGLLARTDANGSTFYHADGAGNVTTLIDSQENIVARYLYNPFGKLIGKWGSLADANVMRFSSMPVHRQSGFPHYQFRDLNVDVSQFLTQDPIAENGGINLYSFVGNNPINGIDPLGLQSTYFDANYGDINSYSSSDARRFLGDINNEIGNHIMPGNGVVGSELEGPLMAAMRNEFPEMFPKLFPEPKSPIKPAPKGSANPATQSRAICGTKLHSDKPGNLPDQLRSAYPETDFNFTKPGVAGPDVEVTGGMHPSFYPYGNWPEGVNLGDFKPNTPGGLKTFNSDSQTKWNAPVKMLTYDPATGKLTTQ